MQYKVFAPRRHIAFPATAALLLIERRTVRCLERAQHRGADNFVGSPSFGAIQTTGSPRRIQLGAKVLF